MTQEEIYQSLYSGIPDDAEERLKHVMKICTPKRGSITDILSKEIDRIRGIKWKDLSFTIHVIPKGTPRPRKGRGNHFYVQGASDNKKFFKKVYKELDDQPHITTACKMKCISYLPIPKSMKKYEMILAEMRLIRPITKPDFDNLAKTYADMIQGTLLKDDALIIEGFSAKYYSAKPRVEIQLSYMEEYDSVFNRNKVKGD